MRKRLSAADKRRKILEEAAKQFLSLGYDGCTLDQVAAAAKVGKQAIYQFFDSKEQLYAEVVHAGIPHDGAEELPLDQPVEGVIEQYLLELINKSADYRIFGMMRINILAFRNLPELADELHESRRRASFRLKIYLESLERQKRIILHDIDTLSLATRFAGVATQGIRSYMGFGWPDKDTRKANARWATQMCLHQCECETGQATAYMAPHDGAVGTDRPSSMRLQPERFSSLCDTGISLFFAHGFEGMNVDALVELTGVSRATIYRNFCDKDGFFRFVVEREIYRLTREPLIVSSGSDFQDNIQNLAEQILTIHVRENSIAMYRLLIEQSDRVSDLAKIYYNAILANIRGPLSSLYQKHLGYPPCDSCLMAFHSLATFGVRFLTSASPVTPAMIRQLSSETAKIMMKKFL